MKSDFFDGFWTGVTMLALVLLIAVIIMAASSIDQIVFGR